MYGLLGKSINSVMRSGFRGFRPISRQYHSHHSLLFSGSKKPTSKEEMVALFERQFKFFDKAGFLTPKKDVLKLICGTEFGYNGWYDPDKQKLKFDAREPISASIYAAVVEAAIASFKNVPEGIVYCFGTAAVDTGEKFEGKPLGENRGFIISSGPKAEIMHFSKFRQDKLDNWDEAFAVKKGDGPAIYRVKDFFGGRGVSYIVGICADLGLELPSDKLTFPLNAEVIISPGASSPITQIEEDMWVIVNDAFHNPFFGEDSYGDKTRVWKPVEKEPVLSKLLTLLSDSYPSGMALLTGISMLLPDSPTLDQFLDPYWVMSPLPYTIVTIDGDKAIDTGEVELPAYVTLAQLEQIALAIKDGANIISNGMSRTELARYVQTLTTLTKDLPWGSFEAQIDDAITGEIKRQVKDKALDLSDDLDSLSGEIDLSAVCQVITTRITELVMSGVGATEDFQREFVGKLGQTDAERLVAAVYRQTIVARMQSESGGHSYLSVAVDRTLLQQKDHFFRQEAGKIQEDIMKAGQDLESTSGEISAKNTAIDAVKEKLKADPNNPHLLEEKSKLEGDLQALGEELARKQGEKSAREQDLESNGNEQTDSGRDEESARRELAERSPDVFKFER
jgi:hypothetical protein